jgi:amidase
MNVDEYRRHDAVALAALISRREVSAAEVLEAALTVANTVDPALGAIVLRMDGAARDRARKPLTGPLAGVPFLIKDMNHDYAGLPTAAGTRALRTLPATEHAEVVRRWLAAGLVIFGKTSTPELGAKAVTEPRTSRPARNPWNLGHTPGGSSGGAAAAVAAGIVPAAGGSDGGGSIRGPAACCGLVGLKPGRGRTPAGPGSAELMFGAAVNGVLTRTVRDTAALLDVMTGPEPAGSFAVAPPQRPYRDEVGLDPGRLRIGFSTRSPLGTPVHPEAVAAVRAAAGLLTGLGHDVVEAEPAIDGDRFLRHFLTMWSCTCAFMVDQVKARTGCGDDAFEPETVLLAAVGRATGSVEYLTASAASHTHTRAVAAFHARHDLLVTPTLAEPPVRIGAMDPPPWLRAAVRVIVRTGAQRLLAATGVIERQALRNLTGTAFTPLANMTGRPALSLPLHWTGTGLPMGVQFMGAPGSEGLLIRLAAQVEAARPWRDRIPPLLPPANPAVALRPVQAAG